MTGYRFFYERLETDDWTVTFPSHIRHVREAGDSLIVLLSDNRLGHATDWPVPSERNVVAIDDAGDREWIVGAVPDVAPGEAQEYGWIERIGDDLWAQVSKGGPRHRIDPATGEVREYVDEFVVPAADGLHQCSSTVETIRGVGEHTVALLREDEGQRGPTRAIGVAPDGTRRWVMDVTDLAHPFLERVGGTLTLFPGRGGSPRVSVDPRTGETSPHAPQAVDGDLWLPTGRALDERHVHAVRPLGDRGVEWSDRHAHGYPYHNFPLRAVDGVLAWTGDADGQPEQLHGLDVDGTVRWTRRAEREDGDRRFVAGRALGDRHLLRDGEDRWYDLDIATGETTVAGPADELPLPDRTLSLPAPVRQAFEVDGLVVTNLDCPEEGAIDVSDVDSLAVDRPRPDHAPAFGPLSADRPILGCSLDGAVRWQVEGFKGREWPAFQSVPESKAWFVVYHATINLRSGEVARTGWRR